MFKIVPEKRIYFCDVCGKEDPVRRMEAKFIINRHALNNLGEPAANGDHQFDACDSCHNDIVKAINEVIKEKGNKE